MEEENQKLGENLSVKSAPARIPHILFPGFPSSFPHLSALHFSVESLAPLFSPIFPPAFPPGAGQSYRWWPPQPLPAIVPPQNGLYIAEASGRR